MDNKQFTFDVYVKGELLGKAKTDERHALIKQHLSADEIANLTVGDVEFKLVDTGNND